jgi:hypothetical protein
MSGFKYYFSNTNFLIPENVIGKSSLIDVTDGLKPKIKKSISADAHEVEDDHPFYTDVSGKYHVLTYEFNDIRVTKYKPTHALYYRYCVKSNKPKLEFLGHPVITEVKN